MPRFAANLSMLFCELPFRERFAAAAQAGFGAVEFHFPYDHPKELLAEELARNGLTAVLHNLPPGDWAAGERGLAVLAERTGEFQDGVGQAIDYAKAFGCPRLNCLSGIAPAGADPEALTATLVDNLRFAAAALAEEGIALLIEPINTRDNPGIFLCRSGRALEVMDSVGADNLRLQYDVYHMQIMEGDLTPTIETNLERIGHIQIADTPGRHEPGSGEINFSFLLGKLDALGYGGWVGCEYKPAGDTLAGLGWLAPWRDRRSA